MGQQAGFVSAGKFNQQHGLWFANQCRANGGCEGGVLQRQIDHGAIDQLHRRQMALPQLHEVLRRIHRLVKTGEVHHAQHFGARQFTQLQGERLRHGQRAFAANQQMRQVDRTIAGVRALVLVVKNIEVVTRHAAHHFGPVGFEFRPQCMCELLHKFAYRFGATGALIEAPEGQQTAIAQPRIGTEHVVHHVAVGNRATAARVVACHATQGGLRTGGHIDRKPQAVFFQRCIQMVEHHAWFYFSGALLCVDVQHIAHIFAVVNHQTCAGGLTTLAGAAAAWHDGHAQVSANGHSDGHFVCVARHKHAHRYHLVNRCVGGIASAISGAEQYLALCFCAQSGGEFAGHFVEAVRHAFVSVCG